MLEITGRRLRDAESRLEDLAFKSIPARLSSLLLRLAGANGTDVVGFTHQDLAEMVGTYRETATQVLNDLKSKGFIEIGRKRIHIRDREGLEGIAEN
jgi:CRP-like cAMP-binding protein